jgi:hypothetical protein
MNPFTIHWTYNFPFQSGIPQVGTTVIKAKSEKEALETFRNTGYPGIASGNKGYYRIEKIEGPGNLINYRV